jgi:citrate synthase
MVEALPPIGDGASDRSVAGRLWTRLVAGPPTAAATAVLNGYLVLLADHELATSTLAARVAASTRTSPYGAVAAALGALDGPLHGTVSAEVHAMLTEASDRRDPTASLADRLRRGQRIPGFGQPLYPDGDPRGRAGLALTEGLVHGSAARRRWATIQEILAAVASRTPTAPNGDFALGALAFVAGMPPDAGEAIFAIARTAGWIAHIMEEYTEPPLRFRTRAVYTGTVVPGDYGEGSPARTLTG